MAPPASPNRWAQDSPSSTQRPARTSRHFDGDKPSFAVPDDYFSSKPKSSKSTAYASPLSFGDRSDQSRKSAPLTKENLDALSSSQSTRPVTSSPPLPPPPPPPPLLQPETQSYPRRTGSPKKSQSPEKKKSKEEYSHPLNLPPEELRRLSARMTSDQRRPSQADAEMTDADPLPATNGSSSPPTTPGAEAPGAFPMSEDKDNVTTNGVKSSNDKSPTPPPHRNLQPKMDPEMFKDSGNKYFRAKDYNRAIEEYTKAVDLSPSNATYLSNRAAAYINANSFEQALSDILQANSLDSGNPKILHRLARVYTSLGRPQDALDTYAKIRDASATDTQAARKAVAAIEIAERTIDDPEGNGNMALWNIDQAKQTLGFGAPMPRQWQLLRAKAYLKIASANALGEVQAITQSLMRDNHMDPEALAITGRAFYLKDDKGVGKSDYQRAEECFRLALSSDPDQKDARDWLKTMKKMERARNEANDVFRRGRYEEAVKMYTDALSIDPMNKITNAKLLGNRATANMKLKNYEEARADCDQALKFDPSYTKAKKTRARAVGEAGDWEQAVKDLKQLVDETQEPELQKELRNAELELKKSKRKDYYKILGVDKDAGDKEIERAYKKKAAVLHPDKTMGDKKKEEEFKDCLEAKETLLDPQKRQIYDSGADLMEPGMGGMGGFPGGFGGMGGGVQIDPEMLFNMMGGMGGGGRSGFGGGGGGGGGMPHFSFSTGGPGGRGGGGFPF